MMSHPAFDAPDLETLRPLFPGYDIESLIAAGGMGAVYFARQRSLDRDVAIKILPRECGEEEEFRESFKAEARAMARLNHPNLISVYDFGEVDGMLFIVMEFVPGQSLYHSSYGIKVDPAQAVELVQAICSGLAHAHENGIIHRDIKPSNILLTLKAEPKIGDFGLARPTDAGDTGLVMGTPGYIAPELFVSPQSAGRRSDIYAVGVILYELVTGQRQTNGCPPPSQISKCDAGLDAIWRRATHVDPAQRYPDANAFHQALADWLKKPKGARLVSASPPATSRLGRPAVGGPRQAMAAPRTTIPRPVPTSGGSSLARNIFLILILLGGIAFTWKKLEAAREKRDRENQEILAENARRKEEARQKAEKKLAEERAARAALSPQQQEEDKVTDQSLEALQTRLNNGLRNLLPAGTVKRGSRYLLFVDTPMDWHKAAIFAEQHSAHLVIPASDEDVEWLASLVPADGALWVGAGRGGRDGWTCVDGSLWQPSSTPRGTGHHIAISDIGLPRATDSNEELPFVIEWHADGSNPGSLENCLAAVRASIESGKVQLPPGTDSFGARHYMHVARRMTLEQAADFARSGGGHLVCVSDETEAGFFGQLVATLPAGERLWTGARREDGQWAWRSGEAWTVAPWAEEPAQTEDGAFVLVPGEGWEPRDADEAADGFVIEWSMDPKSAASATADGGAADPDALPLRARAAELISGLDEKRSKSLAENAKTYTWDLDTWQRGLPRSEQALWSRHVDSLKALAKDNRVPATEPRTGGIALSPKMRDVIRKCAQKQSEVDKEFLLEADKIRSFYVTKLRESLADARMFRKADLVQTIESELEIADDLDAWVASFGVKMGRTQ